MNQVQQKGVAFIIGGVAINLVIPFILTNILPWDILHFVIQSHLIGIGSLILIVMGVITLVKNKNEMELPQSDDFETYHLPYQPLNNMKQQNKVVKVTLVGGLIGLFSSNPAERLNARIQSENSKGWEVVQVLPDVDVNVVTLIIRFLLLFITFFLFTTTNGYYVILKRVYESQPMREIEKEPQQDAHAELTRLQELRLKGTITEEEFNEQKRLLLPRL